MKKVNEKSTSAIQKIVAKTFIAERQVLALNGPGSLDFRFHILAYLDFGVQFLITGDNIGTQGILAGFTPFCEKTFTQELQQVCALLIRT